MFEQNIRRTVFIIAVSSLILISGCDISKPATAETQEQSSVQISETEKKVNVVSLTPEQFMATLELTGKALAAKESYLSLGVPGLIDQISVERGERVKKGQLLLRLDRRGFELGVRQAQAAVEGADVALEQLSTEISRVDRLLEQGAAPTATKDDLLSKEKGAKAQMNMAKVAREQAKKALSDSELRAPYDGVITEILKEKGEQAPSMPPTLLMKIVNTDELEVQVFAPESAARFVRPGETAGVVVESADVTTDGEVSFVSDSISQGTRTFEARVRIDNGDGKIKAGSFARVTLNLETVENALLVPFSSIERDEENRYHVFVVENETARKKEIEIGELEGARVRVTKGLAPEQQLITSGIAGLIDGQRVSVEP